VTIRVAVGRLDLDHVGAQSAMMVVATGPAMKLAASMTRTPASKKSLTCLAGSRAGSNDRRSTEDASAVRDQLGHRQAGGGPR